MALAELDRRVAEFAKLSAHIGAAVSMYGTAKASAAEYLEDVRQAARKSEAN